MLRTTSLTPWRASSSSWWWANGRPATGTSALGMASVNGPMRVPRPPARITTCTSVPHRDHPAVVIEEEADLGQPLGGHRLAQGLRVVGVAQQEAAAAGAHQLSPQGAAGQADLVPPIDARVR